MSEGKKANRLIDEKSPYLLQHAFNPVDWYPWGDEAFRKAREEDRPIFLSIGYSTCYWCHVMEREVFEDTAIARLMNEKLISIKVDREERPEIDRVYMTAVQAMTGSGGWPMSLFLTHDLKPFYAATYIPPSSRYGRPGFIDVVSRIDQLWHSDRKKLLESSAQLAEFLTKSASGHSTSFLPTDSALSAAFEQYRESFDPEHGGFGGGPKFPRPSSFNFLLRYYARTGADSALEMTLKTLQAMAHGGVYDHIGGGFHRYSVDGQWRVPHFEKMLYDQAQLVTSYLEAYQITHDGFYAAMARDIINYVSKVLTDEGGGFYSAEDAESAAEPGGDKEEGQYYLWTKTEIASLLGTKDAEVFAWFYGVTDSGNALSDPMNVFAGKNILYAARDIESASRRFGKTVDDVKALLGRGRTVLLAEREKRPRPHLDDKIITAWNGLMISALAKASEILDDSTYLIAAEKGARFILTKLYDPQKGLLLRRYRDGDARFPGSLQDYAFFAAGLIDLYEASFDTRWLDLAISLTKHQIETFWGADGFRETQHPGNLPFANLREEYDGAEPSGNSLAALNLLRLAQMTDRKEWTQLAERTIGAFGQQFQRNPDGLSQMLVALDWRLGTPREIILAGTRSGEDTRKMLRVIHSRFLPTKVLLLADAGGQGGSLAAYLPFTRTMTMAGGKATAYVCENYACQSPTADPAALERILGGRGVR